MVNTCFLDYLKNQLIISFRSERFFKNLINYFKNLFGKILKFKKKAFNFSIRLYIFLILSNKISAKQFLKCSLLKI